MTKFQYVNAFQINRIFFLLLLYIQIYILLIIFKKIIRFSVVIRSRKINKKSIQITDVNLH